MLVIDSEIVIGAPVDVVFARALDVHVHVLCEREARERVVDAPESGTLGLGDSVTFEAVHLGVRQRLTSRIVEYDPPHRFVDEMQRGAFKYLRHTHTFEPSGRGTLVCDRLEFAAPLGWLGIAAERLFLRRTMQRFLARHQREFRRTVEKG